MVPYKRRQQWHFALFHPVIPVVPKLLHIRGQNVAIVFVIVNLVTHRWGQNDGDEEAEYENNEFLPHGLKQRE